jgi:hypothetical protein
MEFAEVIAFKVQIFPVANRHWVPLSKMIPPAIKQTPSSAVKEFSIATPPTGHSPGNIAHSSHCLPF